MIRSLFLITLLVVPALLRAETISVISGEHADFSRLVLQYPDEEDWTINRFEDGYILTTKSETFDYNLTKVFDLIPKTRIVRVENADNGALKIFTKAGFHLDAFELRAGRLVMDIKDGPAPAGSEFELKANVETDQATQSVGVVEQKNGATAAPISLDEMVASAPTLPLASLMDFSAPRPFESSYFSPENDPLSRQSARVLEMEDALFGQIGRAMSQGLLQADLPDRENAIRATDRLRNIQTPAVELAPPALPVQPQIEDTKHVRIQTAVDRDQKKPLSLQTDVIASCPPNNLLAIETWGEPPQDGLLLSEFRSAALGEFDQPLRKGVEQLAKYYLYLSFGAEAKSVLNEFGVVALNSQYLNLIADVMDDGHSASYELLSDFSACMGATGFWAAAAREDLSGAKDLQGLQIASYFSGLPLHLRQHLGPKLSERFLAIGDIETAKIIQNALSRAEGMHGDAFDLLSAEMQLSDGNVGQAIETLKTISNEDGPSAAEALIRSIDLRTEQNESINKKTAELAEVLMIEHRRTPLENSLARAAILARISAGDASVALASLAHDNTKNLLRADDQKKLINAAALKFTKTFDDLSFAREALTLKETEADRQLTDSAKAQIASRMLDIGFVDLASEFANFEDGLTDSKRLLLGKIAMRTGNNQDALIYLLGVKNTEAAAMRAELYLEMDMPQKAAEEFTLADQKTSADSANFLAENWSELSTSNDTNFAVAANHFATEKTAPAINGNVTISAAQELLDRSQSSRAMFDELVKQ